MADYTAIAKDQNTYYRRNGVYKQLLWSETDGSYSVDVYDGPRGKGYIVREKRSVLSIQQDKATVIGPEQERNQDWSDISLGI